MSEYVAIRAYANLTHAMQQAGLLDTSPEPVEHSPNDPPPLSRRYSEEAMKARETLGQWADPHAATHAASDAYEAREAAVAEAIKTLQEAPLVLLQALKDLLMYQARKEAKDEA
jgi:hypothetical protein